MCIVVRNPHGRVTLSSNSVVKKGVFLESRHREGDDVWVCIDVRKTFG